MSIPCIMIYLQSDLFRFWIQREVGRPLPSSEEGRGVIPFLQLSFRIQGQEASRETASTGGTAKVCWGANNNFQMSRGSKKRRQGNEESDGPRNGRDS